MFKMLCVMAMLAIPSLTVAQGQETERQAAQREAIADLQYLDGRWRGEAWIIRPDGDRIEMIQTERVGPMLGGTLKVIEGRGYLPDGKLVFNAFAIVSYDPDQQRYTIRSYARGHANDFRFERTADGHRWELPAGPATVRYEATINDGVWQQTGKRVLPDGREIPFFGMTLHRIGASSWPAGDPVGIE